VPGLGPRPTPHEPGAVIDLCIRLDPAGKVQRLQDEAWEIIAECSLPLIVLAERNVTAALPAVVARLKNRPFQPD
jgi:hypothetical protein